MFAASKTASVSGGYQISRSLRFNRSDSAYLNRTPSSTGSRTTFTISLWTKLGNLNTGADSFMWASGDATSGDAPNLLWKTFSGTYTFVFNAGSSTDLVTTSVYRDPSAWYHIVVAVDTTQATASNRIKMYVNGVQVTAFSTATYPSQNLTFNVNTSSYPAYLGCLAIGVSPARFYEGYMTEINFIDGQALTPSSFGETNAQTGVWQPKAYSGSYGTNGFYLNFSDNSNTTAATLGKDYSGNGNNWTPNNFSVTAGAGNDSLVDSPTSYGTDTGVGGTVRGNYATMNPLNKPSAITLANGNLDVTQTTTKGKVLGTIGVTSGKWYWEITAIPVSTYGALIGLAQGNSSLTVGVGEDANSWAYANNGNKYTNSTGGAYGTGYASGGVIGVSFDADVGTLAFYLNGVSQGTAYTGLTSGPYFPAVGNDGFSYTTNFGQRPFAYTAPSGFKALCTQNLPTPTIGATAATQAGKFFNAVTYTGNGGTQSITGVGFQPDFSWVKNRVTNNGNAFEDAVRGAGKSIFSNETSSEVDYSAYFTAFTSDGFNAALGGGSFNNNGSTYVAWNWKGNGSGSSNTSGSITSTVSANTTSGFSVVTYTGTGSLATVGHGLGVAPSMVIVKRRNGVADWAVQHISTGTQVLFLNLGDPAVGGSAQWNGTLPTSSVFTVNTSSGVNGSGGTYVAYCFSEVQGYSKFGSYTGNGSSDGVFIYLGFRPKYVMIKCSSSGTGTGTWWINDSVRSPYNVVDNRLAASDGNAEQTGIGQYDFVSNGIKIRDSNIAWNGSGYTYIFMAFAENPFKYSLAR